MSKTAFIADMIIYVENLKESIKKQLEWYEFNEVAGYKINIPNSTVFLYTTNNQKLKKYIFIHLQYYQEYEILQDKYEKRKYHRSLKCKLQNTDETSINGEIYLVRGSEDSVSLRC